MFVCVCAVVGVGVGGFREQAVVTTSVDSFFHDRCDLTVRNCE